MAPFFSPHFLILREIWLPGEGATILVAEPVDENDVWDSHTMGVEVVDQLKISVCVGS